MSLFSSYVNIVGHTLGSCGHTLPLVTADLLLPDEVVVHEVLVRNDVPIWTKLHRSFLFRAVIV